MFASRTTSIVFQSSGRRSALGRGFGTGVGGAPPPAPGPPGPVRHSGPRRRVRLRVLRPAWTMVAEPIRTCPAGPGRSRSRDVSFPCGSSVTRYETSVTFCERHEDALQSAVRAFLRSEEQPGPAAGRTAEGRCEGDVLIASIEYEPATATLWSPDRSRRPAPASPTGRADATLSVSSP